MLLLPFFPLATVLMSGICIFASEINCTKFECADHDNDNDNCYDDSDESFHAYAK
jgi:hypothetical protein